MSCERSYTSLFGELDYGYLGSDGGSSFAIVVVVRGEGKEREGKVKDMFALSSEAIIIIVNYED